LVSKSARTGKLKKREYKARTPQNLRGKEGVVGGVGEAGGEDDPKNTSLTFSFGKIEYAT